MGAQRLPDVLVLRRGLARQASKPTFRTQGEACPCGRTPTGEIRKVEERNIEEPRASTTATAGGRSSLHTKVGTVLAANRPPVRRRPRAKATLPAVEEIDEESEEPVLRRGSKRVKQPVVAEDDVKKAPKCIGHERTKVSEDHKDELAPRNSR